MLLAGSLLCQFRVTDEAADAMGEALGYRGPFGAVLGRLERRV